MNKSFAFLLCLPMMMLGQSGVVRSEGQPLPGATVRATQGDRVLTTITDTNGMYTLANMSQGTWTIQVSMFGFDNSQREVQIGTSPIKIDFNLQLRQFNGGFGRGGFAGGGGGFGRGGFGGAAGGFGRGGFGGRGPQGNQEQANANPNPAAPQNGELNGEAQIGAADSAAGAAVPNEPNGPRVDAGAAAQANPSGANESFLVNGSLSAGLQTQSADFGPAGPEGLNAGGPNAAFGGGAPGIQQNLGQGGGQAIPQGPLGEGGFGGGPPGGFGGGGFGGGRGGGGFGRGPGGRGGGRRAAGFIGNRRNAGQNQIRGSFFYNVADSAFNAAPYSLNGQGGTKASYVQNRFGFNVGGPLEIPKLFHFQNTFFLINYTGNILKNGVNLTSTVPTLSERLGNFSALSTPVFNPVTRLAFANNQIPIGQISPIAQGLLAYIPLPNQPGIVNNYRLIAAVPSNSQALNTRIIQTLSRRDQLGVVFNWQGRDSHNLQNYGFTDTTNGNGFNTNVNWRHNFGGGRFNNLVASFNRNTNLTTPFFANGTDVAAQLGIAGTSSNPINFGPPNLSFTNFSSLTDGSPSRSAIYNFGFNDQFAIRKGKHNWSFGAGYNRYFNNTITDANGRGTFIFSGLLTSAFDASGNAIRGTGFDFADFLIGLPQSNSIRYGSSNTYFRTNSYNAFAQDDWRLRTNLTLNLGLRYEYFAPWTEKYGRIANLDLAPGFTAAAVITPNQMGPFTGLVYPSSLIKPDRNNFAPRTALAWKPTAKSPIVVRLGYGWYFNPGVYNQFISRLSAQPPFAQSTTVNTSIANPLTLATGLTVTPNGKTITNTFAVDPNYRDMYAQTWNVSIQSNLPGALVGEISYIGTKGTRLDIQELPNQAAPGSQLTAEQRLAIGNAIGFTYDTPVGNSIYHALQTRLNRRFRRGFSGTLQYTFSKSIDDSSTLGGAGNTVAQNFFDLSAERGLSSFDRRHAITSNWVWQSPVNGTRGLLANKGWLTAALQDWTISGGVTLQSGTPLTARVLGNQSDIAGTGNLGSGRAQATGLPVEDGSGYFNTLAFTTPPVGQFGNAGRNTIPGPWLFSLNTSLQRTITLTERMRLQIRIDGTNITNHVNITNFGTVVNSLTYGVPTAAGGMRTLSLTLRLNF